MSDNGDYSASGDSGFDNAEASGSGRGSGSAAGRSARSARSSSARSNARSNAGSSRAGNSRSSQKSRGAKKPVVRTKQGGQARADRLRALQAKANTTSKAKSSKSTETSPSGIRSALRNLVPLRVQSNQALDIFSELQTLTIEELEAISEEVREDTGFFVGPDMDLQDSNLMWAPSKIGFTAITKETMKAALVNAKKAGKNGNKKKGVPQPAPAAYLPQKAAKKTLEVGADQLAINAAFMAAYNKRKDAVESTSPEIADLAIRIALALYSAPGDYKTLIETILDVFRERLHGDHRGEGLLALFEAHSNSHLDYARANRVLVDNNGSDDGVGFVDPKIKTADLNGHGWPRLTKSGTATSKKVNDTVREYYAKFSGEVDNNSLINTHTTRMQNGFGSLKPAQVNILNELYPYLTAVGANKGGNYHLAIEQYTKCLPCIDLADAFLLISPYFGDVGIAAGVTEPDMVKSMADVGSAPVNKDVIMFAVAIAATI